MTRKIKKLSPGIYTAKVTQVKKKRNRLVVSFKVKGKEGTNQWLTGIQDRADSR